MALDLVDSWSLCPSVDNPRPARMAGQPSDQVRIPASHRERKFIRFKAQREGDEIVTEPPLASTRVSGSEDLREAETARGSEVTRGNRSSRTSRHMRGLPGVVGDVSKELL